MPTFRQHRPLRATAHHVLTIWTLGALTCLFSSHSWAIYKCQSHGRTSFQEMPCEATGAQGQEIIVQPATGASTGSLAPSPATAVSASRLHQENRLRELDNTLLAQARQRLQRASQQCHTELEATRARKAFPETQHTPSSANQPLHNLALATRDQAISAEMQAIATRCATEQQRLQANLDYLLSEKRALESALQR